MRLPVVSDTRRFYLYRISGWSCAWRLSLEREKAQDHREVRDAGIPGGQHHTAGRWKPRPGQKGVPHDRERPADQQFHRHGGQNRKSLASHNSGKTGAISRSRFLLCRKGPFQGRVFS
jgi:general stress protein YciG